MKADLIKTLEGIIDKIHADSETFRRLVSDKKTHAFSMSVKDIKKQARTQLRKVLNIKGSQALPKEIETIVTSQSAPFVAACYNHLRLLQGRVKGKIILHTLEGDEKSFTAVFVQNKNNKEEANIFKKIKTIKQKFQKPFVKAINKVLDYDNSDKRLQGAVGPGASDKLKATKGKGSAFLDVGHDSTSSVNLQRQLLVKNELLGFMPAPPAVVQKVINEIIQDLSPTIQRITKGSIDTVSVGLEAGGSNRASLTKGEVSELNAQLLKKCEELGALHWVNLEGSDSYSVKVDKRVRAAFFNRIKPAKNIKITKTSTKINKSSSKKQTGKVRKSTIVAGSTMKAAPTVKPQGKKGGSVNKATTESPFLLLGVINNKLPQVVEKNMGAPGLVNRTGQFASSVRLTDVIQTAKGFPSFGYTYQKDPYQVFEMGAGDPRWATRDRDPRKIINQSIREIAAEFAVGRFFTRRE
jgi:hypothetical protein